MTTSHGIWTLVAAGVALLGAAAMAGAQGRKPSAASAERTRAYEQYKKVVADTAAMVRDPRAQELARKHALQVLDLTWEDTGRFKDSAVGDNISDMTIQVQQLDPRTEQFHLTCMPVIRYPNFSDKSGDVRPDRFFLLVGNQAGKPLRKITLLEFLEDPVRYLSKPGSWKGKNRSLLAAKRDTHVLVSAQACFLPVPREGIAQFNPVLFNYQSYQGDPAVLTILATREGASVTVIDNTRDAFQAGRTWGQRLFFNKAGQRCSLTGKRLSDFLTEQPKPPAGQPDTPEAAGQAGLNLVLLIQVPLKQKKPMGGPGGAAALAEDMPMPTAPPARARSDVEAAVIGHGKVEGPFTEIDNLEIRRDERFPVRVTVQFYKATSNGVVSPKDMQEIADQIARVYNQADYVGSLVTQGDTGRPTEHDGPKFQPPDWWDRFWRRHQANTGQTPEQTLEMLRKLRGAGWTPRDERDMEKALEEWKKSRGEK